MKKYIVIVTILVIGLLTFFYWDNVMYKKIGKFEEGTDLIIYKKSRFTNEYYFEVFTPHEHIEREIPPRP